MHITADTVAQADDDEKNPPTSLQADDLDSLLRKLVNSNGAFVDISIMEAFIMKEMEATEHYYPTRKVLCIYPISGFAGFI